MAPFSVQSRYLLLTYAQCGDLDGFSVMDHLSGLGGECIIAREEHADLGLHLHCFVDFGRKFRSRRTDIFDVDGRHPNIQGSYGTPWAGFDYAIKDGDVICGGLDRPEEPRSKRVAKNGDQWTEITNARDRDHFWELVHYLDPEAAARSYGQLAKYVDFRFSDPDPVYESPGGLDFIPGDVDGRDEWLNQSGIGSGEPLLGKALTQGWGQYVGQARRPTHRSRVLYIGVGLEVFSLLLTSLGRCLSLVLFGESRTGKTLWARSLGPHIYNVGLVSGEECMKRGADYAVFDDIRGGIKFFPAFKEWLGCQKWVTVKRLYRDPKLMMWGKPSIWISNSDPRLGMDPDDVTWLEANCKFVEITEAIFRANTR